MPALSFIKINKHKGSMSKNVSFADLKKLALFKHLINMMFADFRQYIGGDHLIQSRIMDKSIRTT